MIFEDVHWIDPTSLEVLSRAVDRITTLSVLLIVTYRQDFDPPWIGRPYVTAININRFGDREVAALIDSVAGNKPLPETVRHNIIAHTDGIPLFVEEMTKAVLETGTKPRRNDRRRHPPQILKVPASLHASLMARLDRLGTAHQAAQIGAAIGREFSHALINAVVRKRRKSSISALDRSPRQACCFGKVCRLTQLILFKHALVQDAAYSMLLREPRRALHARIAETLEKPPHRDRRKPAGTGCASLHRGWPIEKAAGLWGKAGQRRCSLGAR